MLAFIVLIVVAYLIIHINRASKDTTNSGGRTNSNGDFWNGSIRNGKAHGKGRYVFSSRGPNAGDVYEGDICYGSREGYGVYTWAEGTRYEGEWQDDGINGNGTMYYSDGERYEGEWENGERSGWGTMYYSNGMSYSGEWLNDKWNGQGTLRYPTERTHTGEFRNGIHVERGKITLPNGNEYTGEWQEPGETCGRGVWKHKDGIIEECYFAPGKKFGKKIIHWPDGKTWETQTNEEGKLYGPTKITDSNGKVKLAVIENGKVIYQNPETYFKVVKQTDDCTYEAEYLVNGKRTGRGRISYTNCVYEGEWKKYLEHGHGITKWSNGQMDEGQYENGNRVGKGEITWPDGEVYEGEWNDKGPHGYGIWKLANGRIDEGQYENGSRVGKGKITWPNGEMYEGGWNVKGRHGYGVNKAVDGTVKDGLWENDEWVGKRKSPVLEKKK